MADVADVADVAGLSPLDAAADVDALFRLLFVRPFVLVVVCVGQGSWSPLPATLCAADATDAADQFPRASRSVPSSIGVRERERERASPEEEEEQEQEQEALEVKLSAFLWQPMLAWRPPGSHCVKTCKRACADLH